MMVNYNEVQVACGSVRNITGVTGKLFAEYTLHFHATDF